MRTPVSFLLIGTAAFALAACTANEGATGASPAIAAARGSPPTPGGITRRGDSFAMMSEQYAPRAGPYAATGASAWVRPAPAPAFVASGPPPPADPPAPPPAAVANRQPAAPPATPAPAPAALRTAGLALFNMHSCGTCHAMADAGAAGAVGPSLDRNPNLIRAFAIDALTTGRGAMPAFAGQMSDAEIATLADYLVAFSRK